MAKLADTLEKMEGVGMLPQQVTRSYPEDGLVSVGSYVSDFDPS
jgi:hypothetical protein